MRLDSMNQQINQILESRVAIKQNYILIGESGKVYVTKDDSQGIEFGLYEVKSRLINKEFENIVTVSVMGANGCSGPNIPPSPKGLKRLTSMINGTNYRIVQQNGQNFTLEGLN